MSGVSGVSAVSRVSGVRRVSGVTAAADRVRPTCVGTRVTLRLAALAPLLAAAGACGHAAPTAPTAHPTPASCSSDADVLAALGGGPEVADASVQRDARLPGYAVITRSVPDATLTIGFVYRCRSYPTVAAIAPLALADLGWAHADPAHRAGLASTFVDVTQGAAIASEPPGFAEHGKKFAPPTATPAADGGVVVTRWESQPHEMTCGTTYVYEETRFGADGALAGPRLVDAFDEDCGR